ncbi:mediator complex subunit [Lecanora helva]
MPGILPRSEGTPKTLSSAKVTSDIRNGIPAVRKPGESNDQEYRNGVVLTNGNHECMNGGYTNGVLASPRDDERQSHKQIESLAGQLPPDIEHITFGYTPFHQLISRLVQETFNGLIDVINDLSEVAIPASGQHAPSNHVNHFIDRTGEVSAGNLQKKLRLLNFTSDRRAQFIKILVLLRWAGQAEAVSKVIDLNVWINQRLQEYKACISWIGELKRMLGPLRDPNPDIKTALEVLSTGRHTGLSDLGYLPPQTLSSRQLLNTLRKINTLLSIRLNLHEAIPPAFRDFSVGSGRATFHVREEFEVDLSIAEEDPSSQLFFIDFRFQFSPMSAGLPAGRLRDQIEGKANEILKREGLEGLYDFLHNFTLTHKLSVLRNQAYEMAKGYWCEHLKIEAVHRSVVVQYWLNRPGGKNWIEIGLKRGRETAKPYSLSHQRIPHIGLRWFRGGKEVTDAQVTMRLGELSLAFILKQVISLHISYNFERMAARMRETSLYSGGLLRLKSTCSATEPTDASLLVQLSTAQAIKVVQEPVAGRFSILPASRSNSRAEYELNRNVSPASNGASQLTTLRSQVASEEADLDARSMGWEPIRSLNPNQETTQRLFGKAIQTKKFFKKSAWLSGWILAFTSSIEGDFWWIIELADKAITSNSAAPNIASAPLIRTANRISVPVTTFHSSEPLHAGLAGIEKIAAVMISQLVDTRALALYGYRHKIQAVRYSTQRTQVGSLLVRIALPPIATSTNTDLSWLNELVRLEYYGLDPSRKFATHMAKVHMQRNIDGLQNLLTTIPSVAFEPATQNLPEAIKLQFHTKVGETVISQLRARLIAIELLLSLVSTLRSNNLSCNAASLTRLVFGYTTSNTRLKAAIQFPEEGPRRIALSKSNPHLRVVDYLTDQIRTKSLSAVLGNLRLTLPLLRTFSMIEAGQDRSGIDVLTRSDQWFQVRYSEPFSRSGFDVRLRIRRDHAMWFIPEASIRKPENGDHTFAQALKSVTRGKGDGWWGVNGGMISQTKGVEDLIIKLDVVFRTCKQPPLEPNPNPNPRKRKAEDEVVELD